MGFEMTPKPIPRSCTIPRTQIKNEVLGVRQGSQPNMCRVHDAADYNGQLFLSMEQIDGEDLASLLK
jgi:hypothetical protein